MTVYCAHIMWADDTVEMTGVFRNKQDAAKDAIKWVSDLILDKKGGREAVTAELAKTLSVTLPALAGDEEIEVWIDVREVQ